LDMLSWKLLNNLGCPFHRVVNWLEFSKVISKSPLERSCFDFRNFSFTRTTLITADHLIDRKVRPVQSLTLGLHKSGGRNNTGHITVRHRGGGHKRRYRIVDFKRNELFDIPAVVNRLELDPNRKAPIALITYQTGHLSYILAPVMKSFPFYMIFSKRNNRSPSTFRRA